MPENFQEMLWDVPEAISKHLPERILQEMLSKPSAQRTPSLRVIRNLDVVEGFAGSARIAGAALQKGLRAVALDREFAGHMDILTDAGWLVWLTALLRLRRGGLLWLAPQCSTWVWMNRKSSGRSAENPLGFTGRPTVDEGNLLNRRTAFLLIIAGLMGVLWVIEQPVSSVFFETVALKTSMAFSANTHRCFTWLSAFGHPMPKPTILRGTPVWLPRLEKTKAAGSPAASSGSGAGSPGPKKGAKRSKSTNDGSPAEGNLGSLTDDPPTNAGSAAEGKTNQRTKNNIPGQK